MHRDLLAALPVAALLVYLLARSGVDAYPALIAAAFVLAYTCMTAGRLLLAAARAPDESPSAAFVMGLIATSLAAYASSALLSISAGASFAALFILVALADFLAKRRALSPVDWRSWTGFALCIVLTAIWCRGPAAATKMVQATGVLPLWSDYWIHGSLISQFGDPRAVGHGSIFLAGHPYSFYHFASYAAPAALAWALDQPGLPLAVAAWLPLGFLAMLAGTHALGERLAGAAGGLVALIGVAMLPDASNYALRNGWFSFHFTLLAHPGAAYAIAAAFLSLVLLERWRIERLRATLAASALLVLAMLLFRAHIFLLHLPAWLATAALCAMRPGPARSRVAWYAVAVLTVGAFATDLIVHATGSWRVGERALGDFLWIVHTGQEPTAYGGVYETLVHVDTPVPVLLAIGALLAALAGLGAFLLAAPLAVWFARRAGVLRPIDAALGYLFLCWLLLMFTAPTPWHGDPTDLIHRPFVLLYAAAAVWTLCLFIRAGARQLWRLLLAGMVLALPFMVPGAEALSRPKFAWASHDDATQVPPGLTAAASYLRKQAAPGDIVAVAGLASDYVTFDLSTQLCALSGMPAFLSRPWLEMVKDAPRKAEVVRRLAALDKVAGAATHREAMETLRVVGVQWYVVAGAGPSWDPARSQAAFTSGTVSLYNPARQRIP